MNKSIFAKALTVVIIGISAHALGADKSKMMNMEMTTEQRQTMAATHEKMATCMRSDKPMDECKTEMMKSCEESMGKDGCHKMMGKMHGMKGMHGMNGMQGKMKNHNMTEENESTK